MRRERGIVTIQALGGERFEVKASGEVHEAAGYEGARTLAHRLAQRLGHAI